MSTLNTYNLKSPDSANTNIELDASGNIAVRAGSAASPSIYVTGDSNTGIYSPGADQVAISTGGSGRLFIDGSGRVLVNSATARTNILATNTVGFQLEGNSFDTSNLVTIRNSADVGAANLILGKTRGTTVGSTTVVQSGDQLGVIRFTGSDGTTFIAGATIQSHADGTMGTGVMPGYLAFSTTPAGAGGPSERLRITSAGLVGVGTSSPEAKLDIASLGGASNAIGAILRGDAGTGNSGGLALYNSSTDANQRNWYLVSNSTIYGDFAIKQGNSQGANPVLGTDRFYISNLGNVGIGTTAPATQFSVQNTSTFLGIEADTTSGFASGPTIRGYYRTNTAYTTLALTGSQVLLGINDVERARLDASGRLLLGTSSTSANTRMVLQGNSGGGGGAANLHFSFDGATPTDGQDLGFLIFGDNTQSNGAWIRAARDGGTWSGLSKPTRLVFSTTADGASSPTERMRITQGGYLKLSNTGAYIDANGLYSEITTSSATNSALVVRASSATYAALGGALRISCARNTTNDTFYPIVYYNEGAGLDRFIVADDGDVRNTNNAYGAISDIKLKENIADANSQWDDIKAVQVRNYNLKAEPGHRQIGVVAQEIEQVSPGLVYESPDRDADGNDLGTVTKSVNYSVLYMKAVKALQEAMERIEVLEQRLADAGIA